MKKRRNFRKKPKDNAKGLSVTVFNNNVEGALKVLKRKVKDSNLFIDLRKKEYYEKPSKVRREKRNMAKLRNKYAQEKVEKKY
jgi:small subunit ribosomal protein S21